MEILDSKPKVGLVYSSCGDINEDGVVIRENHPFSHDYIINGEEEFKKLIYNNHIAVLTAMVRRECYTTLGLFNEAVTGNADREMWIRISLNNYDIAFVAKVLAFDRKHSDNVSNYHSQTNLKGMNTYRTLKTVAVLLLEHYVYFLYWYLLMLLEYRL